MAARDNQKKRVLDAIRYASDETSVALSQQLRFHEFVSRVIDLCELWPASAYVIEPSPRHGCAASVHPSAIRNASTRVIVPRYRREGNGIQVQADKFDVIHSVVHMGVSNRWEGWHGPEFAREMLRATNRVLGVKAAIRLEAGYTRYSVSTHSLTEAEHKKRQEAAQAAAKSKAKREGVGLEQELRDLLAGLS